MALTFYNYGRDSQCVFFSLQESGQITNTPLSLDTTKHSRYITLHHAVQCKSKDTPPTLPAQLLSGLLQIRQALLQADSYTVTEFIESFQKHLYQGLPAHKLAHKITKSLKSHLTRQLLIDTRSFLRHRLSQVPWLFSSSSHLLESLHITPSQSHP